MPTHGLPQQWNSDVHIAHGGGACKLRIPGQAEGAFSEFVGTD
jgi:hypothetical protein